MAEFVTDEVRDSEGSTGPFPFLTGINGDEGIALNAYVHGPFLDLSLSYQGKSGRRNLL